MRTTFEQMKHVEEIERSLAKTTDAIRSFAETRDRPTNIDHLGAAQEAAVELYLMLYAHQMLFGSDASPEPRGLLRGKSWLEGFDPNL
jgi:hypothetical protein